MPTTPNSRRGLSLVANNTATSQIGDRIVRIAEVCEITGLSRTTIWRRINDGSFPPSMPLGPEGTRARGWRHSNIQAWIDTITAAA